MGTRDDQSRTAKRFFKRSLIGFGNRPRHLSHIRDSGPVQDSDEEDSQLQYVVNRFGVTEKQHSERQLVTQELEHSEFHSVDIRCSATEKHGHYEVKINETKRDSKPLSSEVSKVRSDSNKQSKTSNNESNAEKVERKNLKNTNGQKSRGRSSASVKSSGGEVCPADSGKASNSAEGAEVSEKPTRRGSGESDSKSTVTKSRRSSKKKKDRDVSPRPCVEEISVGGESEVVSKNSKAAGVGSKTAIKSDLKTKKSITVQGSERSRGSINKGKSGGESQGRVKTSEKGLESSRSSLEGDRSRVGADSSHSSVESKQTPPEPSHRQDSVVSLKTEADDRSCESFLDYSPVDISEQLRNVHICDDIPIRQTLVFENSGYSQSGWQRDQYEGDLDEEEAWFESPIVRRGPVGAEAGYEDCFEISDTALDVDFSDPVMSGQYNMSQATSSRGRGRPVVRRSPAEGDVNFVPGKLAGSKRPSDSDSDSPSSRRFCGESRRAVRMEGDYNGTPCSTMPPPRSVPHWRRSTPEVQPQTHSDYGRSTSAVTSNKENHPQREDCRIVCPQEDFTSDPGLQNRFLFGRAIEGLPQTPSSSNIDDSWMNVSSPFSADCSSASSFYQTPPEYIPGRETAPKHEHVSQPIEKQLKSRRCFVSRESSACEGNQAVDDSRRVESRHSQNAANHGDVDYRRVIDSGRCVGTMSSSSSDWTRANQRSGQYSPNRANYGCSPPVRYSEQGQRMPYGCSSPSRGMYQVQMNEQSNYGHNQRGFSRSPSPGQFYDAAVIAERYPPPPSCPPPPPSCEWSPPPPRSQPPPPGREWPPPPPRSQPPPRGSTWPPPPPASQPPPPGSKWSPISPSTSRNGRETVMAACGRGRGRGRGKRLNSEFSQERPGKQVVDSFKDSASVSSSTSVVGLSVDSLGSVAPSRNASSRVTHPRAPSSAVETSASSHLPNSRVNATSMDARVVEEISHSRGDSRHVAYSQYWQGTFANGVNTNNVEELTGASCDQSGAVAGQFDESLNEEDDVPTECCCAELEDNNESAERKSADSEEDSSSDDDGDHVGLNDALAECLASGEDSDTDSRAYLSASEFPSPSVGSSFSTSAAAAKRMPDLNEKEVVIEEEREEGEIEEGEIVQEEEEVLSPSKLKPPPGFTPLDSIKENYTTDSPSPPPPPGFKKRDKHNDTTDRRLSAPARVETTTEGSTAATDVDVPLPKPKQFKPFTLSKLVTLGSVVTKNNAFMSSSSSGGSTKTVWSSGKEPPSKNDPPSSKATKSPSLPTPIFNKSLTPPSVSRVYDLNFPSLMGAGIKTKELKSRFIHSPEEFPWASATTSKSASSVVMERRSWGAMGARDYSHLIKADASPQGLRSASSSDSLDMIKESPKRDWRVTHRYRLDSGTVPYIDSHCHIDFLFNRSKYQGTWTSYRQQFPDSFMRNYEGCITNFCDPNCYRANGRWHSVLEEAGVWGAFGCHPKSVSQFSYEREMFLRHMMSNPKVVALGEIGLDYSGRFGEQAEMQKEAFDKQLEIAVKFQKPLVIHCRQAEEDCLKIMKKRVPHNWPIHRHCFTDDWATAQPWMDYFSNCYLGLTPLVTYKNAREVHEVAGKVPLSRLLLETDAPYFVPNYVSKNQMMFSTPGFAICVADEVARIRAIELDEVLRETRANTRKMYGV